ELRLVPWAARDNEPDFHISMGSAIPHFRKSVADFPRRAFLTPNPERAARIREGLEVLGNGPRIGICWRSMMLAAKRSKYYSALDMWGPILKVPGVRFVNVQYGEVDDELARAIDRHGIPIHRVEGLDLKDDIDGAAALSSALDLVISAPTAAAAVAASVGTETWFLTAGRTWPQLGTNEFPWYRDTRVFSPEKFADWPAVMAEVAAALETLTHTG
ncbi:MAG: flagellar protein FlbA, partial [Rhizomicrobium sp.]